MTPNPVKVSMVVAVARNGVIGSNGGLVWKIADDLKWFKSTTLGKPIIMGRKTFDSIGRALPGRRNIVVTRQAGYVAEGADVVNSLDDAIALASETALADNVDEICIIGGGELYRLALAQTDRIYLSRVDADVPGDVFFPVLIDTEWRESHTGSCEKSSRNEFGCQFVILDRILTPN